jgi:renalase
MLDCLIIGAGLAGLTAARQLQSHGRTILILDKGRGVGGRLATRRIDLVDGRQAIFDHGAQFFTVRSPIFAKMVAEWEQAGAAAVWSHGFPTGTGYYVNDGHPRYKGTPGMTAVAKHLARDLPLELNSRVTAVQRRADHWQISAENQPDRSLSLSKGGLRQAQPGESIYRAASLLMTPPMPQTLALLGENVAHFTPDERRMLTAVTYEPCLALMVVLDRPSQIPPPGALQIAGEPLSWVADNQRKGVSPVPAVTIHAGPQFSATYYDAPEPEVSHLLLASLQPWLGAANVLASQLHRWRYSKPIQLYPDACLYVSSPPPLALAGDAFAGPRVEGAVLSGLAAAEALGTTNDE